MTNGGDQADRLYHRTSDEVSLTRDSSGGVGGKENPEARIAETARAIAEFFSSRPASVLQDAYPPEVPIGDLADIDPDRKCISSARFSQLDGSEDDTRHPFDAEHSSAGDEIKTDRRGPHREPIGAPSGHAEGATRGDFKAIEGVIARLLPGEETRASDQGSPPEVGFTPGRMTLETWGAAPQAQTGLRGESAGVDVELQTDGGQVTRLLKPHLLESVSETLRENSRVADRVGLGSEHGLSIGERAEAWKILLNPGESDRVNIPLYRVIASSVESSAGDTVATRPPQASVSAAPEVRGVESTWPSGIQADLQRMNELLETLVAESSRGRLGGMPGLSSRPHSLR